MLCVQQRKNEKEFSKRWQYRSTDTRCRECCTKIPGFWTCSNLKCQENLPRGLFAAWMTATGLDYTNGRQLCHVCFLEKQNQTEKLEERVCSKCGIPRLQNEYLPKQWNARAPIRRCKECKTAKTTKGCWTCSESSCRKQLPKKMFKLWMTSTGTTRANNRQVCNECFKLNKECKRTHNEISPEE